MIVARTLTDQAAGNPSQGGPLLDQIDGPIVGVTADGTYDGAPTYHAIVAYGDDIEVVILPRATAVSSGKCGPPTLLDRQRAIIAERGLRTAITFAAQTSPLATTDRCDAASR